MPSKVLIKTKLGTNRNVYDYTCNVCGDRATKYHYGSVVCNACRQFFKRTVIKKCPDMVSDIIDV